MNLINNIEKIKEIIPHRYPFLLIDSIKALNPSQDIVGVKNVSINEEYFKGHFPNNPVMPGVLIIEALAQTGAVLILSMEEFKNKTVYLTSIEKVRFYKKVLPGDVLILKVSFVKKRGSIVKFNGLAEVKGIKYAVAEIVCAIE
jgi:3-hydroxyacyl-[acyl-carrier-protein] dehydratase